MRKLLTSAAAILALVISSCSREPVPQAEYGKEVELRLTAGGELPAVRSSGPEGTVYMVVAYSGSTASDASRYAIGVFDDTEAIAIKFTAGANYIVRIKAVIDGRERLYQNSEGVYANIGHLTNRMHYYATDKTDADWYKNVTSGRARTIDGPDRVLDYPLLDTYYGELNWAPAVSDTHFHINLYRVSTGVKVRVNGLQEGDGVVIPSYFMGSDSNYAFGENVSLSWDSAEYEAVHTYMNIIPAWQAAVAGTVYSGVNASINASYLAPGASGSREIAQKQRLPLYRSRYNVLTVNLSHE